MECNIVCTSLSIVNLGPHEHPHSMLQNKMTAAKLGFEIYALTTILERADVKDGQGASETLPKPLRRREGHRAAFNVLEGY